MSGRRKQRRRMPADRTLRQDDVVFDAMQAVPLGPKAPVDRLVITVSAGVGRSLMQERDMAIRRRRLWAIAGAHPPMTQHQADTLRARATLQRPPSDPMPRVLLPDGVHR